MHCVSRITAISDEGPSMSKGSCLILFGPTRSTGEAELVNIDGLKLHVLKLGLSMQCFPFCHNTADIFYSWAP